MLLDHRDDFLETLQTLRTNVHNVALRLSEDQRNFEFCDKLRAQVNENINPSISNALNGKFEEAEDFADAALTNFYLLYRKILGKKEDGEPLPRGQIIVIYPPKNIPPLPGAPPTLTSQQSLSAVEHFIDTILDAAAEILSYDGVLTEFTKVHMAYKQGDLPSSADSLHHTRALINSIQLARVTIEGEDKNAHFAGVLKRIRENIRKAVGDDLESAVKAAEEGIEIEVDHQIANEMLDENFALLDRILNSQIALKPLRKSEEATAAIPGSLAHMKSCLKKAVRQLEDEKSYEFPDYYRAVNRRHGR